jgi:hypothetical protein
MILTLSPISAFRPETTIFVLGDVLTVDGIPYDLSPVPEGGEGWPEGDHPFVGPIRRDGGAIHATVRVFLGPTAAPDQPDSPWTVEAGDGPVAIPCARTPA